MMLRLRAAIDRWFRLETINGGGLCATYMYRWTLLAIGHWRVYLHHFVASDWSRDPHDHPKAFLSIGLCGSYLEFDYRNLDRPRRIRWTAPWIRRFPATHRHRIELDPGGSCWTICVVGKPVRDWGFWYHRRRWVRWDAYVHTGPGAEQRDC